MAKMKLISVPSQGRKVVKMCDLKMGQVAFFDEDTYVMKIEGKIIILGEDYRGVFNGYSSTNTELVSILLPQEKVVVEFSNKEEK